MQSMYLKNNGIQLNLTESKISINKQSKKLPETDPKTAPIKSDYKIIEFTEDQKMVLKNILNQCIQQSKKLKEDPNIVLQKNQKSQATKRLIKNSQEQPQLKEKKSKLKKSKEPEQFVSEINDKQMKQNFQQEQEEQSEKLNYKKSIPSKKVTDDQLYKKQDTVQQFTEAKQDIDQKKVNALPNNSIFKETQKEDQTVIVNPLLLNKNNVLDDTAQIHKVIHYTQSRSLVQLYQELKDKNILLIDEKDIINHFQCIGKGGCGTVFKGQWQNVEIAIKEINISYDELKFMIQELEFLSKCRYPSIVQLYGVCIRELTQGHTLQCQIIMELLQTDLDAFLFENKVKLNTKQMLKILQQTTSAIQYLHKLNMVHRDIKPKNVLLDKDLNAKLADLGITRILENKTQTRNVTIAYTMQYASPETALQLVTSFKSDIWSLGILIYEVATGKRAWSDIDNMVMIAVGLSQKKSPLVDNWENLIEDEILIEIIKFTVHYDPEKRLSADEIYGKLDSIIKKKG